MKKLNGVSSDYEAWRNERDAERRQWWEQGRDAAADWLKTRNGDFCVDAAIRALQFPGAAVPRPAEQSEFAVGQADRGMDRSNWAVLKNGVPWVECGADREKAERIVEALSPSPSATTDRTPEEIVSDWCFEHGRLGGESDKKIARFGYDELVRLVAWVMRPGPDGPLRASPRATGEQESNCEKLNRERRTKRHWQERAEKAEQQLADARAKITMLQERVALRKIAAIRDYCIKRQTEHKAKADRASVIDWVRDERWHAGKADTYETIAAKLEEVLASAPASDSPETGEGKK